MELIAIKLSSSSFIALFTLCIHVAANIYDMKNIGVAAPTLEEWSSNEHHSRHALENERSKGN